MPWISDSRAVEEALRLRAWALEFLCSPAPPPPPPPDAGAAAWDVFLRTERCALALNRGARAVTGQGARVLQSRSYIELQRVLSVRGQMARLARMARENAWTVAVLKGGAAVAAGENVDLMDLDVLAPEAQAHALSAALGELEYANVAGRGAHRVGVRAAHDSVHVEIHTSVPGLDDATAWTDRLRPSPQDGLWMLDAADHLWYALHHSAEQHPDRRGRLRELLVLEHAVRGCTPAQVEDVDRRIAAWPRAGLLRAQLDLALALARKDGAPGDPFVLTAAGNYVIDRSVRSWKAPEWLRAWLERAAVAAVARREGYASTIGDATLELPSRHGPLRLLGALLPPAERLARTAGRRGPEWALAPIGGRVAAAAERFVAARR